MKTERVRGTVIATISILLIALLAAALLFATGGQTALPAVDGSSVVASENGDDAMSSATSSDAGYVHGSNVKNNTSGTRIYDVSGLVSALSDTNSDSVYYLDADLTLGSDQTFTTSRTFAGTLYGNGHTVTVSLPTAGSNNISDGTARGGLVSSLSGRIYDTNVLISSGALRMGVSGNSGYIYLGGIAGVVTGSGVIENCTVTINSGVTIFAYYGSSSWGVSALPSFGAVAGKIEGGGTITNITVANNGELQAGLAKSSSGIYQYNGTDAGSISLLVGYINQGTMNIDNIIVSGSGSVTTFYGSMLGMLASSSSNVTTANFYNKYTGSVSTTNNGNGMGYVKYDGNGSAAVTNMYRSGSAYNSNGSYGGTISNTVTVDGYSLYFDPAATDVDNSLALVFENQSKPSSYVNRVWTVSGNSYSQNGTIIEGVDSDTVVFRNMPTAAATWSVGGNFTAQLGYTDTVSDDFPSLTKYEHGFVPSDHKCSGSAITSGSDFYSKVVTADVAKDTEYYLEKDISITGFTGYNFAGTLDGNGKTIYITAARTGLSATSIGGLVGTLTGTIKNVRIVILGDVSVNMSGVTGENSVGIVAGTLDGGTIENVNVVIPDGSGVTLTNNGNNVASMGGVVGMMNGTASISNTTVQLDGSLNINGSYVFLAGFVGSYKRSSASTLTLTNNIIKGVGKFGGDATNSGGEPKHVAAIAVLRSFESSSATLVVDGFVYSLHSADGNNSGYVPVAGSEYSSYGYIVQNNAGDKTSSIGTNGKPAGDVGVTCSNIFVYDAVMNAKGHQGNYEGNTFVAVTTTATVAKEVTDVVGSTVTPYFLPDSSTAITLVVAAPASGWGDVTVIACDGTEAGEFSTDGQLKVVSVAKLGAVKDGTVSLSSVQTVGAPQNTGVYAYTGSGIEATVIMMFEGAELGAENYTLSYSASGSGASLVDGKPFTAGVYTVTVTLNEGYTFYTDGKVSDSATVEITVDKAQVSVEISAPVAVYDGSAYDETVTVTPDGGFAADALGAITWEYKANGEDVWTEGLPTDAGEYAVRIKNIGNAANIILSSAEGTLTIDRKEITLTVSAAYGAAIVYGSVYDADAAKALVSVICTESGIGVEYTVTLTAGDAAYTAGTPAGTQVSAKVVATPTDDAAANYIFAEPAAVLFEVQKKDVTVTAGDAEKQYGDENPSFEYQVTAGEFYDEITVSYVCGATKASNAGETFDIVPSVTVADGADGNYNITCVNGTLTVVPRQVTIGLSDDPSAAIIEYPGLGVVPNAELLKLFIAPLDTEGQALFLTFSVTKDGAEATALYAGTYTVTAALAESYENEEGDIISQANYAATAVAATLTVKAKEIVVTKSGEPTSREYDGNVVTPADLRGLFFTDDIYEEGGEVVLVVTVVEGEVRNAGTYTVTVALEEGAEKMYAISSASVTSVTYTVTPAEISVEWGALDFVYNGTEQKPEASATGIGDEVVPVTVTVKEGEAIGAGNYTAVASTNNANYTFINAEQAYEIARAALDGLSVTIDGWTYGGVAATPEVVGNTQSGAVAYLYESTDGKGYSDSVAPTAAGDYRLTVTVAETDDYQSGSASCDFTVAKATLADATVGVVADYDGAAHGISVAAEGFVGDDTLESAGNVEYSANGADGWTTANIVVTDATTVAVTVYYRVTFDNYETVEGSATVTVNPRNITVDGVTAVTREYDGTVVVQLAGGNLVGIVPDDEVTLVLGTGTVESADAGADKAVTTAIALAGADADNYVLAQPAVTAEITRRTVTIGVAETAVTREYDKDVATTDYALLFTAPVGVGQDGALALSYAVTAGDTPVADGIKFVGVYTVAATLADADGNYTASAATVTYTVTVRKIAQPVFSAPALTYNGAEQSVTIDGNDYYTVGGTTAATDAGKYYATVSLVDAVNTAWADDSSDALSFEWSIAKATPTVSVVVTLPEDGLFASDEELPAIAVGESDVTGSVAWDEGQSLVAGENLYKWTFTPDDADNYNTASGTYTLSVTAVEIDSIAVTKAPDKVVYEYGDSFDKTGMEVTVTYNNHATKVITDFVVDATVFDTLGDSVAVRVTYEGKETSVTVRVVKKSVAKPSFDAPSCVYDGSEHTVAVAESQYYTVGGTTAATDAGKYYVTVSLVDAANTEWEDGSTDALSFEWSIAKATSVVTPVVSYDGTLYTSDDLYAIGIATTVGDTVGTIAWDEGQTLVAGENEYNWTFVPTDAANYDAASGTCTLTVTAVVLESLSAVFDAGENVIYASASLESLRQYLTVTGVCNDGTSAGEIEYTLSGIIKAGDCTITVTATGTELTTSFTVTVVGTEVTGIEIAVAPAKSVYTAFESFDKAGMVVNAIYADGNVKPVTDYTVEGGVDLRVGTDKVTVAFGGFTADVAITVNPVIVAAPAPSAVSFVYNAQAQGVTVAQSEFYTVTGIVSATDAGDYSVTVTLVDSVNTAWDNGASATIVIDWSIEKADYDMSGIAFEDDTVEYDGKVQSLTVSGTLPTGADGSQVTVTYSAGRKDVGSVVITATFATTSDNYNAPAAMTATLTVTAKTVEVVWRGQAGLVYNGEKQMPKAVVGGGVIGETVQVVVTVDGNATDAGTYTATATLAGDNANYVLTNATIEYTIAQARLDAEDVEVPDNIVYTEGQSLDEIELPVGWEWVADSVRVNAKGDTVATAVYTSSDGNYQPCEVEIVLASASSKPSTPDGSTQEGEPEGLTTGAIVGIAVGAALLLAVVVTVIVVRRKRRNA